MHGAGSNNLRPCSAYDEEEQDASKQPTHRTTPDLVKSTFPSHEDAFSVSCDRETGDVLLPATAIRRVGQHFVQKYLSDEDPMPWVSPVSGGGIQLSWKRQANELSLGILPDGRMEYLKSSGIDLIEEDEQFSPDRVKVQSMLAWVRSHGIAATSLYDVGHDRIIPE